MDTNTVTPTQGEEAHEEEIHMPPPSWSPIILALGMTLLVFGVSLASIVFVPLGAVNLRPREFTLPLINTVVILVSAVALWWGERGIAGGDKRRLIVGVSVAAGLGLLFMTLQTIEFSGLGFRAQGSSYGSMFVALLVFHILRVFVGVGWLAVVLIRAAMHQFDARRRTVVQACAMYWYFITVIWLIVFAVLYLL
ncbi:MAG: cytochrome c oxidase subunit 3 [Anaerolineae bacterium]|nr:cytochrome c oxidase subunit 3 [Anaerolineae bacterium]